jgi:O-antigen ligase
MQQVDALVPKNAELAARVTVLPQIAKTLARIAFSATIILLPWHARVVLLARPVGTIYGDYTDFLVFASDVFLISTLACWLVSQALERQPVKPGPLLLTVPIAGITAMALFSSIVSVDPALSLYNSIRLLLLGGLYLYVVNEIKSISEIIPPIALMAVVQALVGILQVLQQHSIGWQALGELVLDPSWSGVSIVYANGVRSLRAYGLSDHPNILGGCFAFALILLATWFIQNKSEWRTLGGSVFALGAIGLFLTFSRAAWLAAAFGLSWILYQLFRTRQTQALQDAAALLGAACILVLPYVLHDADFVGTRLDAQDAFNLVAIEDRSITERAALNEAANRIFVDHALLGVGVGALPQALRNVEPDFAFNFQPAHITFLDAATETGLLGGMFYMLAMITPWLAMWLYRRRLVFTPALVGLSGLLLAVTLIGLFDYYTWLLAPGRLLQWLTWGLWAGSFNSSLVGDVNA